MLDAGMVKAVDAGGSDEEHNFYAEAKLRSEVKVSPNHRQETAKKIRHGFARINTSFLSFQQMRESSFLTLI